MNSLNRYSMSRVGSEEPFKMQPFETRVLGRPSLCILRFMRMQHTSVSFTIVCCYHLWFQVLKGLIKGCMEEWTDKHTVQIYKILHTFLSSKNLGDQIWVGHVEVNRNRKKQSGMSPAQRLHLGCLNCLANSVYESFHAWLLFCL